jgi:hypothetical protein
MLVDSRVSIEAARLLAYETSKVVDLKKGYEHLLHNTETPTKELREQAKQYSSLAAMLTPMAKYLSTEYANDVSYKSLQVHGGTGYMKDFNVERHCRDARITNIYEGTTQLQYVAAIGGVVTKVMEPALDRMESEHKDEFQKPYLKELKEKRELLNKAIDFVREKNDHEYQSYYQDRLVDMAAKLFTSHLFLRHSAFSEEKKKTMDIFFEREFPQWDKNYQSVISGKSRVIEESSSLLDLS